jgi:hypothetical protein
MKKQQPRTITRSELYAMVWKTPMHTLAPEFGISDVGLAKLCRRNGIPLPPPGYWAKVRFGKRVRRPPLPKPSQGQREDLVIEPTLPREALPDLPPEIAAAVEAERNADEPIAVPQSPKPHPIVASWERARQPSYGPPNFTPATEARRRRIASVLFREIEKRGGKIKSNGEHKFEVAIFGQTIEMTLAEKLAQAKLPLTPDDLKYGWHSVRGYKTELHPTGQLRLRFENYFDSPVRREWLETEEKPLEGRLREVIVALFVAVAAERKRAEAFAERERQRFAEEQRRWEIEERRREERERVADLLKEADAWAQARRLREYVDATQPGRDDEWGSWARRVADSIDPSLVKVAADLDESGNLRDNPYGAGLHDLRGSANDFTLE